MPIDARGVHSYQWLRRMLLHPAFRVVIPLGLVGMAIFVLHQLSGDIPLADVKTDANAYSWADLAMSFGAMCLSYLALSVYDVIILRGVSDAKVPLAVKMMTGVSSMAVSNMLGFSWLTGAAVRYRVYSAFGVNVSAVAKLIATSWISFLIGIGVLLGALFVFHPTGLSEVISLPVGVETTLGLAMLTAIVVYFLWTAPERRAIGFGPVQVTLPLARDGAILGVVAAVDLMATALILYVLMPGDLSQNFVFFFVVFVAAVALGILSHSPGGLGVFEATIIAGLGAAGRSDALAALVLYRVIYTVLPFALAVIGLSLGWALAHRHAANRTSRLVFAAIGPIVPLVAAGLAMASGAVLLISGSLPSDPERLEFLQDILPLGVVETSHLLGSVSGVLLLVVARGLYRRRYRAWVLALGLLGTGLLMSLLKGGDWQEATALGIAVAVLWVFRAAFYRADVRGGWRPSREWILSVCLLIGVIVWIGFFAYSNVQYTDALWWQFAWNGDASRFLRATLVVFVILSALLLNTLLGRQTTRLRREPIPDAVRRLVAQSSRADAGIALSGDKRFVVTLDIRAFVAYADTGRTLVSKGDPVGAKDAGIAAIWQLRDLADVMGRRCAFYGVSETYLPTYLDLGLQILKIAEVARVDLRSFTLDGAHRKDWRHAMARIARDGYVFEVIKAADLGPVLPNLHAVSDAWLAHKQNAEKGFSLGWFHPDYARNFDHAVLRHGQTGHIAAFANLMQAGDKSEVSLDLMRYDPAGPGIAMDALFAEMMLWGKAQGFAWFSLGAAPLSGLENRKLAPAWHRIGSFVYQHGTQVYHCEGLRAFKQKFDPVWSPEYLASAGPLDAARVLSEVSLLVSGGVKGMTKSGYGT